MYCIHRNIIYIYIYKVAATASTVPILEHIDTPRDEVVPSPRSRRTKIGTVRLADLSQPIWVKYNSSLT